MRAGPTRSNAVRTNLIAIGLAFACTAPGLAQDRTAATGSQTAKGTFVDAQGKQVGTASLSQTQNGVLIRIEVRGLPEGVHAFHVHETGKCEPQDQFKSAGGHFAPRGEKHGYETAGGPHAGDMPNQHVSQGGMLKAEVLNPGVTLGTGQGSLFDQDGSALVIHAKADDYKSQPAGDAGDRIACAIIQK